MWLCEGGFIDQQFSSQHCSCADMPYLHVSPDETVDASLCCRILANVVKVIPVHEYSIINTIQPQFRNITEEMALAWLVV